MGLEIPHDIEPGNSVGNTPNFLAIRYFILLSTLNLFAVHLQYFGDSRQGARIIISLHSLPTCVTLLALEMTPQGSCILDARLGQTPTPWHRRHQHITRCKATASTKVLKPRNLFVQSVNIFHPSKFHSSHLTSCQAHGPQACCRYISHYLKPST